MQLDLDSREMLLQILQKRQMETRRDEIAKTASESLRDYYSGNGTSLTAKEAIEKLESL